jgi:hypothetical protein
MFRYRTALVLAAVLGVAGVAIAATPAPTAALAFGQPTLNPLAQPPGNDPAERPANYQPPDAYYDWKKTMQPERPYFYDYDKLIVMKVFLAEKSDGGKGCKVYLTLAEVAEVLRKLDNITCGAPKIVYVVGWQGNGHDSKYPAWAETGVNPRLKRPADRTALDSLKWLLLEARRYHTVVSLHINALDATEDSPLWGEYLKKDIIAKDKAGRPLPGEVFSGQQSYQISYAREWETGCAKRRIDNLIKMLPELKQSHTIHIDAFHTVAPVRRDDNGISPYLGYTKAQESAAQRKFFRYFRDYGIDVTSEGCTFLRNDPFIGLQPMAWAHDFNFSIPPKLLTFTPMRAEPEVKRDPVALSGLLEQFALSALPFLWANNWRHEDERNQPQSADWAKVRKGTDVCFPLFWKKTPTLFAYSRAGYAAKTWELPANWRTARSATVARVTNNGDVPAGSAEIENGKLALSLKPGEAVTVTMQLTKGNGDSLTLRLSALER